MAIDIDEAFVRQYESEVHTAYQRMGSKFRNTVRQKNNVKGKSTTFQKVGKGEAAQKSRHGNVPVMSIDHTPVECILSDWYAADYVDKLDELKVNHDERQVVVNAGAYALGRKTDTLIIDAMETATNQSASAGGMTLAKTVEMREFFDNNDVPDDGGRYCAVSPKSWTNLLSLSEFSNADYVSSDELPYQGGMTAKRWQGFLWWGFSGLPIASNVRHNYAYHTSAIGHASGSDVRSEINYIPEKVAHLITNYMSQGAVLIDNNGVYRIRTTE
jgi:hypothetical protein